MGIFNHVAGYGGSCWKALGMPWVFYEIIIFGYLIGVSVLLLEWKHKQKHTHQKKTIFNILITVLLVGWITIFYGSFVEPRLLFVRFQEILIGQTMNQLHAVVVSDIHVGPYKQEAWVRHIVEKVNEQDPDVVFLLGDFIFSESSQLRYLAPLSHLKSRNGVYAVLGNHDFSNNASEEVIEELKSLGVEVLQNESRLLEDQGFLLAGVSDLWFDGDIGETLKFVGETEKPVILLSHNPDVVLQTDAEKADLIVSAHTHGGQIRLPWMGPLLSVPTVLGKAYDRGLFAFNRQQLFITSGVSETGPRARLFTPPEIVNLIIKW